MASLWAPAMAPNVFDMHYQISSLFEMLDVDTRLTPEAKNRTGSILITQLSVSDGLWPTTVKKPTICWPGGMRGAIKFY